MGTKIAYDFISKDKADKLLEQYLRMKRNHSQSPKSLQLLCKKIKKEGVFLEDYWETTGESDEKSIFGNV